MNQVSKFLDSVDEKIENLDPDQLDYSSRLSDYCKEVGLFLFRRCYYEILQKDTTSSLNLWIWWAERHNFDTTDFADWWDFDFF